MKVYIVAGKGGVGKSTVSSMFALFLSKEMGKKVLLIDNDGKHAHTVSSILNLKRKLFVGNMINPTEVKGLCFTPINPIQFMSISETKKRGIPVEHYLAQLPGDYGYYAICDMPSVFWSLPIDIPMVTKFLTLIEIYHKALNEGIDTIVLDMEPTEGLERLIRNIRIITRSLKNLQKGSLTQTILGQKFKDIGAFFKGPYIKKADYYVERMEKAADALRAADFILVSIPEITPLKQMLDLEEIITSVGGKIAGYVINNPRGGEEEKRLIEELSIGPKPVIVIEHDAKICNKVATGERLNSLIAGGKQLSVFV